LNLSRYLYPTERDLRHLQVSNNKVVICIRLSVTCVTYRL